MLLTLRSLYERQPLAAETGAFAATGGDAGLTYTPVLTARGYALGGLFPTYVQETSTRDFVLPAAYVDGTLVGVLNNYSLTVDSGAFVLTGQSAAVSHGYRAAAGIGSFTLTGNAAALRADRKLTAATGTFALTGQAASLNKGQFLSVSTGAFALTGNAASLRADRKLTAGTGAFTLAGNAVALVPNYPFAVSTGAFTFTGNAAGLRIGRVLTAATAAFTLTGNDAELSSSHIEARSYALGGLLPTYVQDTTDGEFIVGATFLNETFFQPAAYSLSVAAGAFTLTGNAAGLSAQRKIAAGVGASTLTGNATGLYRGLKLSTATASFVFTGSAAGLTAQRTLSLAPGAFTLAGQAAGLYRGLTLAAQTGSFALTGNAASLTAQRYLGVDTGAFTLTGNAAGLSASGAFTLTAETGAFTLAGGSVALTATAAAAATQATGGGLGPFAKRQHRRLTDETRGADGERFTVAKREGKPRNGAGAGQPAAEIHSEPGNRAAPLHALPLDVLKEGDLANLTTGETGHLGGELGNTVPESINQIRDRAGGLPQPDRHDVAHSDDRRSGDEPAQEQAARDESHSATLVDTITNDNDFILMAA